MSYNNKNRLPYSPTFFPCSCEACLFPYILFSPSISRFPAPFLYRFTAFLTSFPPISDSLKLVARLSLNPFFFTSSSQLVATYLYFYLAVPPFYRFLSLAIPTFPSFYSPSSVYHFISPFFVFTSYCKHCCPSLRPIFIPSSLPYHHPFPYVLLQAFSSIRATPLHFCLYPSLSPCYLLPLVSP